MKPPLLLHVVRDVDRVERDRRVEEAEEDDQRRRRRRCSASRRGCERARTAAACQAMSTCSRACAGNIRSDEAKIGGMTPAVLTFSGRCVAWPPYIFRPTTRLAYWTGSGAGRARRRRSTATTATMTTATIDQRRTASMSPDLRLDEQLHGGVGHAGDDAREDDQRDAVADAALGDLLAEPHDERGAGGERDHRHEAEAPARIGDDLAVLRRRRGCCPRASARCRTPGSATGRSCRSACTG